MVDNDIVANSPRVSIGAVNTSCWVKRAEHKTECLNKRGSRPIDDEKSLP